MKYSQENKIENTKSLLEVLMILKEKTMLDTNVSTLAYVKAITQPFNGKYGIAEVRPFPLADNQKEYSEYVYYFNQNGDNLEINKIVQVVYADKNFINNLKVEDNSVKNTDDPHLHSLKYGILVLAGGGEKGDKGDKGDTGPQGPAGRDGAIQYTAGEGINITNNVISAINNANLLPERFSIGWNLVVNMNQIQFTGYKFTEEQESQGYTIRVLVTNAGQQVLDKTIIGNYLQFMTGNKTIDEYNAAKPTPCFYFSQSNETLWKLQFVENTGLVAFKVKNFPFATKSELELKQDTLTAGQNITIVNNVISATGGGTKLYQHTKNSISYYDNSLTPLIITSDPTSRYYLQQAIKKSIKATAPDGSLIVETSYDGSEKIKIYVAVNGSIINTNITITEGSEAVTEL